MISRSILFARGVFGRALAPVFVLLVTITALRADLFITNESGVSRYDTATATLQSSFISLFSATGLTFGADGSLYVATTNPGLALGTGSVYRYDPLTGAQLGGPFVTYNGMPPGPDPHDVIIPAAMRFGPNGNLYIADTGVSNVHVYDSTGASLGALTDPSMSQPIGLAFGPNGAMYVTAAGTVLRYDFGSSSFTNFANPVNPVDISIANTGEVYVLDASSGVIAYSSSGTQDAVVVDFSSSFFSPHGMKIGPDGKLYISGDNLLNPSPQGEILRYDVDGTPEGVVVTDLPDGSGFMAFSPVPEPSTYALLTMGLVAAALIFRRRARSCV